MSRYVRTLLIMYRGDYHGSFPRDYVCNSQLLCYTLIFYTIYRLQLGPKPDKPSTIPTTHRMSTCPRGHPMGVHRPMGVDQPLRVHHHHPIPTTVQHHRQGSYNQTTTTVPCRRHRHRRSSNQATPLGCRTGTPMGHRMDTPMGCRMDTRKTDLHHPTRRR